MDCVNWAMWRGKNIAFEFRSAEGKLDRLPELASELVRLKVEVIVALYVPLRTGGEAGNA